MCTKLVRLGAGAAIAFGWLALATSSASTEPVERDVQFEGAGTPIAGTLVLPAVHQGRVPAVLLIQGSGPTDRNGNHLPLLRTDLLRQLAQILGEHGIASLRYDKRGLNANAASLPHAREALTRFTAWANFVGDAEAAFRFLAADPAVDGARVGIIGHSEGGLIALSLAHRGAVSPKALVLLATPGRPLADVIADQLAALLDRQKASMEARKFFLDANRRISTAIIETGAVPSDVPPGLRPLYPSYLGPFLQSLLRLDPVGLARDYSGPILVINGTSDVQVSAKRDAEAFAATLDTRRNGSEVATPADVSHNMKHAAEGEPGIEGPIDAAVRDKLMQWLAVHL